MATKLTQLLKAAELEKLDCYLHEAGAPGLHVLVAGLSGEKGRRTVRRAMGRRVDKGFQKNSVLVYVLEPLGLAKARTLFSEMVAGPSVTREEFAALMYAKRLGGFYLDQDVTLSRKAFSVLVSFLASMLEGSRNAGWRFWASLDMIGLLDVDPASEGFDVLKASVDNLTSQFESRLSDMSDRWEIGSLVAKVCQLKDMDDSVHRLLRVMALMKTTDPGRSMIWPAVDRATLQSLQSIAEKDNDSFEGFLKIFPAIAAGRRSHPDFDKETMHSDISRAIQMARTKSGAVQKGAITFLAENLNEDLPAIVALLLCSCAGEIPEDWIADLVRGTARQLKPNEARSFLLPIFSHNPDYPPAVRAEALDSMRDVVKLLTYELPESRLGLPFEP